MNSNNHLTATQHALAAELADHAREQDVGPSRDDAKSLGHSEEDLTEAVIEEAARRWRAAVTRQIAA